MLEAEICKEKGAGRSRGIGFITMKTRKGLKAALEWDGSLAAAWPLALCRVRVGYEYRGRTLKISVAESQVEKAPSARLEVFIRGLAPSVTEDLIWKDFLECGKIQRHFGL